MSFRNVVVFDCYNHFATYLSMEKAHGKIRIFRSTLLFLFTINLTKDAYKQWTYLPNVQPHWLWGNRPILSKNIKDQRWKRNFSTSL